MTRRFRLSSLIRVRQIQEDAAKAAIARARGDLAQATDDVLSREGALHKHAPPQDRPARAYVAALAARHTMAGDLAASIQLAAGAERVVDARLDDWSTTSVNRRAVDKLATRFEAQQRKLEEAASQRVLDEHAGRRTRDDETGYAL